MSNFSFLEIENEYTQNVAYQKMVEYAIASESYFYVMDIACAQYARYSIEQYVQYVSALYKIQYTNQPLQLAHFLYGENAQKLIAKIGPYAFAELRNVNDISKVYCHVGTPRSGVRYKDLLIHLYNLMVELYKHIAGRKATAPEPFDYQKITPVEEIITPEGSRLKVVPANEIEKELPEEEPVASGPRYEIKEQEESILLLDEDGNVVNRYVDYGKYQGSEAEKNELEGKLKEIEDTYTSLTEDRNREVSARDAQISGLQKKIRQEQLRNSDIAANLKRKIDQLETEKQEIRTKSDQQIAKLQEKWSETDNKYQSLYASGDEERKKLKAEIVKLLDSRKKIKKELVQVQTEYSAAAEKLKAELQAANDLLKTYHEKDLKNEQIIPQLEQKVEQLEREKKDSVADFERKSAEIQSQIDRLLENKEQWNRQNKEWQDLVSRLIFENDYYKEICIRRARQEEKQYLLEVHNAIQKLNTSDVMSRRDSAEQQLREYLLQVKQAYEDIIENERKQTAYWKDKYEAEHAASAMWEEVQEPEDVAEEEPHQADETAQAVGAARSVEIVQQAQTTRSFETTQQSITPQRRKISFSLVLSMFSGIGLCLVLIFLLIYVRTNQTGVGQSNTAENSSVVVMDATVAPTETLPEALASQAQESPEATPPESHLPDGSAIQESLNRKIPPESWSEVEGVNEELLQEITTINRKVLDYYDTNADHYESLGYQYLGKHGIFNTSYSASIGTWYERGIFQESLYYNTNAPLIQFFYYRSGVNAQMGFAVLPQDLSTELSTQSTVEDLTALFAEEPSYMGELDGVTDFSTADKEIGVTYKVGDVFDALFLFDENGAMCDYVYISASPEFMWN